MTDATKAAILLGALALAAMGGAVYGVVQAKGKAAALHHAAVAEGEAHAAQQAEAQAKAERAAADQVAQQQAARVADLEHQLAQHPHPAPAVPVPMDATAADVVAGLQGLGLRPSLLGEDLALTTPDGRTVLGWGRESLRVPGLEGRLAALEGLTAAQRDQAAAQEARQAATDRALTAADAQAAAQQRRANNLQRAVDLTPRWRPRSAGLIVALDSQGQRHLGALASYTLGPIEIGGLYVNHTAGAYAVIRF